MSTIRTLITNTALVSCLLCLSAASSLASAAGDTGVIELLRDGYEVKAAYQAPGEVVAVHYLILQKGSSAYQCASYSSTTALYNSYSNTYSCSQIINLIPTGQR